MSKLSDAINTSLCSSKQRERFDDSKNIKVDRGICVVKKHNKLNNNDATEPSLRTLMKVFKNVKN